MVIPVSPDRAYAALMRADLSRSTLVRVLLFLRRLPGRLVRDPDCEPRSGDQRALNVASLEKNGFTRLAESPPNEIVFGLMGRFWKASGGVRAAPRDAFLQPVPFDYAVAVWNFSAASHPKGSLLSTETRVLCGSSEVKEKFRRYWTLVRPFSGLIRWEILKAVRAEAARV